MRTTPTKRPRGSSIPPFAVGVGISFLPEQLKQLAAIAKRRKLMPGRGRSVLVREALALLFAKESAEAE